MPKKLTEFTAQLTTLAADDRVMVARPGDAADYYASPAAFGGGSGGVPDVITTSPQGVRTPTAIGEFVTQYRSDFDVFILWVAQGTVNTSWRPIGSGPVARSYSPIGKTGDYIGQEFIWLQTDPYGGVTVSRYIYVGIIEGAPRWNIT